MKEQIKENKLAGLDWPALFEEFGLAVEDFARESGDESIIDVWENEGMYTDQYGNPQLRHTYHIDQKGGESTLINVFVQRKRTWNRTF